MTLTPSSPCPRPGFTLVELLATIAILAILAAILIPTISTMRHRANAVHGAQNLRGISSALSLYATENNGQLPEATITAETWNERHPDPADHVNGDQMWTKLLRDYLPQQSSSPTGRENPIFVCPNAEYIKNGRELDRDEIARTYTATEALYGQDANGRWSKEYRRQLSNIPDATKTVIVVDGKAYKGSNASLSVLLTRYMTAEQAVADAASTTYLDFRQPGDTINILYVDGHVARLTFPEFQQLTEAQWTGREP